MPDADRRPTQDVQHEPLPGGWGPDLHRTAPPHPATLVPPPAWTLNTLQRLRSSGGNTTSHLEARTDSDAADADAVGFATRGPVMSGPKKKERRLRSLMETTC